jgi:hypothetical protein
MGKPEDAALPSRRLKSEPPSSLSVMDSLSQDLLANVIGWVGATRWDRKSLLPIRALSSAARDAVQLAVGSHGGCHYIWLNAGTFYNHKAKKIEQANMSVEKAAALGRVFGGGCKKVTVSGADDWSEDKNTMMLEAACVFQKAISPRSLESLTIDSLVMPDAWKSSRDVPGEPAACLSHSLPTWSHTV